MTRHEALRILGLSEGASADSVRKAYRKRAFETHPDRGGTAAQFLTVQAAYEILTASFEDTQFEDTPEPASGFDAVLNERLVDISYAFRLLYREADSFCDRTFEEYHGDLVATIDSYQSYSSLRRNAQRDIGSVWSKAVKRIASFVEGEVGSIADRHDRWLQEYLRPVVDAARLQSPPYWFERSSVGVMCVITGLLLVAVAVMLRDGWAGVPATVLIVSGVVFPLRYENKFAAKANC